MDFNELYDKYVNKLLDNIANEKKSISLLGDFNIYLLKYDRDTINKLIFGFSLLQYDFTLNLTPD